MSRRKGVEDSRRQGSSSNGQPINTALCAMVTSMLACIYGKVMDPHEKLRFGVLEMGRTLNTRICVQVTTIIHWKSAVET